MILVQAPEGHDIGMSKTSPSSFEDMDMDSILDSQAAVPRPQAKKKSTVSPPVPSRPKQKRPTAEIILDSPKRRPAPTQPEPIKNPADELAPTDDWVNPATKKKQRLVLMLMASIGGLLVLAALGYAVFSLGGGENSPVDTVAHNDSAEEKQSDPVSESPDQDKSESDAPLDGTPDVSTDGAPEIELPVNPSDSDPPEMVVSETPPEIIGEPPSVDVSVTPENDDAKTETSTDAASGNSIANNSVPSVKDTDMETLKSILADSGTSLLEIRGAASNVRGDEAIGTPKYYFEKSPPAKLDFNRQKAMKLLGVSYDKLPLQTVLHELSAISGLALSIDVPTISAANLPLNPPVTIKLEDETTASVVRSVAQSVGLAAIETDVGFWISTKGDNPRIKRSFSIGDFVEGEIEERAFVNLITRSIYPQTWVDASAPDLPEAIEAGKGTIEISKGELIVEHATAAVSETERLVEAVKQAMNGQFDSPLFEPVPSLSSGSFGGKYNGQNSIRISLSKLIDDFAANYDTTLIVDWQSLGKSNWTPGSMAHGWIDEETVGDAIKESAHSMRASKYLADDNSAWLTSSEIAFNIFEIKLYRVGRLAGGKLSQRRLEQIFRNALGNQLQQPGVSVSLFAGEEIAVVRAPQSLHRQIGAVVSALSQ
jgi:hypothetical protein